MSGAGPGATASVVGRRPSLATHTAAACAYVVWIAAGLYAALLATESVHDHDAFGTSFDLAHYDQMLWLLSRGMEPFSTIVTRPMLADHFQPGLVLLTPVYWLGSGLPVLPRRAVDRLWR